MEPYFNDWISKFPHINVNYNGTVIRNEHQFWEDVSHNEGRIAYTLSPNAEIRVSFTGTQIEWIGIANSYNGIAEVFLDGVSQGLIDTFNAEPHFQNLLFRSATLPEGNHRLEIKSAGMKNGQSRAYNLTVDAFRITVGNETYIHQEDWDRIEYINANQYAYANFMNRKIAHIVEFFIIHTVLYATYAVWGWKRRWQAAMLALVVAVLDEFHQSFIANRTASLFDIGIDGIGIALSLLTIHVILVAKKVFIRIF